MPSPPPPVSDFGPGRTKAFEKRMGARILALRQASGMTQTQLGEAVGVSRQQIRKFEEAIDRVSGEAIQAMAAALDVPIASFFDEAPGVEIDPERGEVLKVTEVLMRLPPRLRARLIEFAIVLAANDTERR